MRPIIHTVYRDDGTVLMRSPNRAAQARMEMTYSLRQQIIRRDKQHCRYCTQFVPWKYIEVDHVKAVTYGGQSTLENCVTACRDCNQRKGWSRRWVPVPLEEMPKYKNDIPAEIRKLKGKRKKKALRQEHNKQIKVAAFNAKEAERAAKYVDNRRRDPVRLAMEGERERLTATPLPPKDAPARVVRYGQGKRR